MSEQQGPYKVGQYSITEEPGEGGVCWHVRGPGIHSVVEKREEALWAVGICDAAFAAGQRSADAGLREALEQVERWEFPAAMLHDGTPCSYGAAYGSNGERDFMRAIARAALAKAKEGT